MRYPIFVYLVRILRSASSGPRLRGFFSEFEAETHLNRETDIGKEITQGEMASLIIHLEMRTPEKNL